MNGPCIPRFFEARVCRRPIVARDCRIGTRGATSRIDEVELRRMLTEWFGTSTVKECSPFPRCASSVRGRKRRRRTPFVSGPAAVVIPRGIAFRDAYTRDGATGNDRLSNREKEGRESDSKDGDIFRGDCSEDVCASRSTRMNEKEEELTGFLGYRHCRREPLIIQVLLASGFSS